MNNSLQSDVNKQINKLSDVFMLMTKLSLYLTFFFLPSHNKI